MSENSSKESRPLEVLKEQASPDYPPFDNELYGETISIVESSSGSTASGQQSQQPQQQIQQQQSQQQQQQQQQLKDQNKSNDDKSGDDYYYVPLRFATVRKSFTLPHNISGSAATTPTVPHATAGTLQSQKTKDLAKFLGLIDDGPGVPSPEVAQAEATSGWIETSSAKVARPRSISRQASVPRWKLEEVKCRGWKSGDAEQNFGEGQML